MLFTTFLSRIGMALLCGCIIGFERQFGHRYAGIRAHSLVAVGAAIYVLISLQVAQTGNVDVTRTISQVISGVGFICAGVIIHQGVNVSGLATSASIWCSSGIGCLAAAGFYAEALACTGVVLFINIVMVRLDNWIAKFNQNNGQP